MVPDERCQAKKSRFLFFSMRVMAWKLEEHDGKRPILVVLVVYEFELPSLQ